VATGAPSPLIVNLETATRLPGAQFEPAWSPDGTAFVFANRDANPHKSGLYLQRSGEMQPRLIVEGLYNSPVFSPDGRTLAAVHVLKDAQELVLVDLEHSTTRTLTRLFPHRYGLEYRHLDWSPDGSLLAIDDKATEADPLSLYLVHISSGDKYRLTFPDSDIIGDISPRFSPDGSELAFIRIRYQGQNIVMHVSVTGSEASVVLDPSSLISDVDWLSNDRLLYVARLDDRFRFWTQSILSPMQPPKLALSAAMDTPVQFALQRRGDRLALSAFRSNLNIWSMTTDGTHNWQPIITTPGQDVSPTYSPDGTRIAFRSDLGGRERIWISSVDGTNAHALDTGEVTPAVHAWDADSQTILFNRRNERGLLSIRSIPGATVQHVSDLSISHPASSIDGKSIFARTGHFVYRLHRDTGRVDKLTTGGGAPLVPSQDGRYLYFADGRMGSRIERLNLQTGQQQIILNTLLPGYNESWALTSSGIYFLTEQAGVPIIAFHDLATGKDRFVSEFLGDMPPVGDSGFAASPTGDRLMIVRGEPIACNIQITSVPGLKTH
jgi:Tol biopolymer transport system component